jgi:large exoprotein involved in heme utilization and adhesion
MIQQKQPQTVRATRGNIFGSQEWSFVGGGRSVVAVVRVFVFGG